MRQQPKSALRSKQKQTQPTWELHLFVAGATPNSTRAIVNLKRLCEEYLAGRYDLQVIDLYQQPGLAHDEQIIAVPTLIKKLPLPMRYVIGDMSNTARVLEGLDLQKPTK